jgi:hypothetical protein
MNELNSKFITTEDLNNFNNLMDHINILKDNEYSTAYIIQKEALRQYDRWSTILFDIRTGESRGIAKNPALKDRVAQILKMIDNSYVTARMVWGKAKDDITGGKY